MKIRRRGIFLFFLIAVLFVGLMGRWLWYGERGFIHLYKMDRERRSYLQRIAELENENMRLLEEVNRLKTDKAHIEAVARRELGLIKEDEILFRFSKERKQ